MPPSDNDLGSLEDVDTILPDEDEAADDINEQNAGHAVVYSTDWTVETIISQLEKGNIDVKPRFQRRDAWGRIQKSKLIESLILGLPIPQIVLALDKQLRGKFIVLDGKQRLLSLLQFVGKSEDAMSNFRLQSLAIARRLNGKSFADLSSSAGNAEDLNSFHNATIRSVVIKDWPSKSYLDEVFVRLNTNSVPLSPHELRQALLPGPFTSYLDEAGASMMPLQKLLGNRGPDFRMRDSEIVLRHLAFRMSVANYRGNLKSFLDLFCFDSNRDWIGRSREVEIEVRQLHSAIQAGFELWGDDFGKKWLGDKYETRVNRAVLDVLMYYLAEPSVAVHAMMHEAGLQDGFKDLCRNGRFRSSVEQTTKSIDAVRTRFEMWRDILSRILDVPLELPPCIR